MKGKKSNTLHNFLMFEVSKDNSKVMPKSSSISWFKASAIPTSSFNLKLVVMVESKALFNNQCFLD
jgi:hypothetical protein